eukprot:CAMPEP_0115034194 /NCGR_PEP_ID=MMETSP0216-20121206/40480_1 /TAXON_ID=223996 /ORGANISM="Protocruzia adherens, Strain Boccale" /LENGTH=377 /DNA_ID=CAMNT_0002412981 /DNA_START=227 /DNA_END=1360 /DNA_ORIENTATION=+
MAWSGMVPMKPAKYGTTTFYDNPNQIKKEELIREERLMLEQLQITPEHWSNHMIGEMQSDTAQKRMAALHTMYQGEQDEDLREILTESELKEAEDIDTFQKLKDKFDVLSKQHNSFLTRENDILFQKMNQIGKICFEKDIDDIFYKPHTQAAFQRFEQKAEQRKELDRMWSLYFQYKPNEIIGYDDYTRNIRRVPESYYNHLKRLVEQDGLSFNFVQAWLTRYVDLEREVKTRFEKWRLRKLTELKIEGVEDPQSQVPEFQMPSWDVNAKDPVDCTMDSNKPRIPVPDLNSHDAEGYGVDKFTHLSIRNPVKAAKLQPEFRSNKTALFRPKRYNISTSQNWSTVAGAQMYSFSRFGASPAVSQSQIALRWLSKFAKK